MTSRHLTLSRIASALIFGVVMALCALLGGGIAYLLCPPLVWLLLALGAAGAPDNRQEPEDLWWYIR